MTAFEIIGLESVSQEELKKALKSYDNQVQKKVTELFNGTVPDEEIEDLFFNEIEEVPLLTFEANHHRVELLLSRYSSVDSDTITPSCFGACYTVHVKNLEEELQEGLDFNLDQELDLIQYLEKLGLS